jgi:hypothetical protein
MMTLKAMVETQNRGKRPGGLSREVQRQVVETPDYPEDEACA